MVKKVFKNGKLDVEAAVAFVNGDEVKQDTQATTLITSPACTIVVDGVAYVTGETCPGEYPNFGKVTYAAQGEDPV